MRGNTCCQLFVMDKGFLYVVPMRSKRDLPVALKQFAKEIGAPDAIVMDMSGEQMSAALKKYPELLAIINDPFNENHPDFDQVSDTGHYEYCTSVGYLTIGSMEGRPVEC